jgi:sugar O-acyltransferase (sialic acid O-acetyltransferase NeuD family)
VSADGAGSTSGVVVFGAGSFAALASRYLEREGGLRVAAFTVDEAHRTADTFLGRPLVPFEDVHRSHPPELYPCFVALGYSQVNRLRAAVFERCRERGYEFVSHVSPHAHRSWDVSIGASTLVMEAAVLQENVRLGDGVIVWSGALIAHDTTVGDHCFLAPRVAIAGNVTIGPRCFLGVNSTVRDGVAIGSDSVIGAGAVIMRDTRPGAVHSVPGTLPRDGLTSDDLTRL